MPAINRSYYNGSGNLNQLLLKQFRELYAYMFWQRFFFSPTRQRIHSTRKLIFIIHIFLTMGRKLNSVIGSVLAVRIVTYIYNL